MQAPVPPLEKAWEFKADSNIKEPGPIAACDMIFFGSKDGLIYALDAASGQKKWTFRMGKSLKLPLSTEDGIIFAASEDKNFYAVDAQTGQKRWQFFTGNDFGDWSGHIWIGPIVANDAVYIATKDKNLHALDVRTGKERWQFATGGDISPPAVGRDSVFFGSKDKRVYALQTGNGKKIWESKTDHEKYSSPILADDKVLIAGDDDLYALDPSSGKILWTVKKVLHYQGLPAVTGGLAFCTKELEVIDVATGKEMEKIPSLNDFTNVFVVDETLYATALPKQTAPLHTAHFLFAYDVATRKEKWQACFDSLLYHVEIGGGFVFIPSDGDDKLVVINTSEFSKRWESDKLQKGGFLENFQKPIIAYGMVYLSGGKMIHAFRSSRDPASQQYLEIRGEISSSPKYVAEMVREEIVWPNCCCLCCGPSEGHVTLNAEHKITGYRTGTQEGGIPYCKECYKKITKLFGREKPGVELIRLPPTYAFRNEKYWAMFMEANRLR